MCTERVCASMLPVCDNGSPSALITSLIQVLPIFLPFTASLCTYCIHLYTDQTPGGGGS